MNSIDYGFLDAERYILKLKKDMRQKVKQLTKKRKKQKNTEPLVKISFFITEEYSDWQQKVLDILNPEGVSEEDKMA